MYFRHYIDDLPSEFEKLPIEAGQVLFKECFYSMLFKRDD